MQDLKIAATVGQWLNTAFMLTMAIVIPTTGYLQQRFSTRTLYVAAMTAFVVGTMLGALSPNFEILLLGRIVQAMGSAIMFPLLMTTIMDLVPEDSRGRIMGNIGIVMSVAPAMGPAVSGLILNWRFRCWPLVAWFTGLARLVRRLAARCQYRLGSTLQLVWSLWPCLFGVKFLLARRTVRC